MRFKPAAAVAAIAFLTVIWTVGSYAQTQGYRLNSGDVLQVSVWKEDELNREVLVRPDGGISFPLVGDIPAANRTVEEVQSSIVTRLESEQTIRRNSQSQSRI